MAEVTAFRNNALPYPVYGVPWVVVFPLLDADGDPVTGATCDSEVSKNGDTAVDCTNEGAEIAFDTATNKGMYYLILTTAEMTADIVAVTVYSATSKATVITLYPRKLVSLRSGTAQGGAAGYITLDASAGTINDTWNGCLCVATIDGNEEARIIDDYDGTNEQAAVTPDWNVEPDADDTFIIYLPEGMQMPVAVAVAGDVKGGVTGAVGSVTGAVGSVTGAVGSVAGNVDGSTASVVGAVGSVTGAVGSVTGAVGSVTGAVGSVVAAVVTDAASRTASKADVSGLSTHNAAAVKTALEAADGLLDWLRDVAEGDIFIDTGETPWQLIVRKKGTEDALLTKNLLQADGTNVTAATHLVGRHTEP